MARLADALGAQLIAAEARRAESVPHPDVMVCEATLKPIQIAAPMRCAVPARHCSPAESSGVRDSSMFLLRVADKS